MGNLRITDSEYRKAKKIQEEMRDIGVKMSLKECYVQVALDKEVKKQTRFGIGRIF